MKLKEYRIQKGLSTIQLAGMIGVADTTIRRWEKGDRRPIKVKHIDKITEITNGAVQPNDFYLNTDNRN